MRAGWSPPPRQEYDFSNGGEREGDGGGRGSVSWGEEDRGDSWEKRRRREERGNVGEVRGQLVLAPGGGTGESSTTMRVRIREEGAGDGMGESAQNLTR